MATGKFGLKTLSTLVDRMQLAFRAGIQFDGARDLYAIFGYKKKLDPLDLLAKYTRQDIASRIVDAPPGATWSNPPSMDDDTDAGVKTAWEEIAKAQKIWGPMYRVDRLTRLNPFALLLFGFDDSTSLEKPVRPGGVNKLLYVRALGSRQVQELEFDSDVTSPRFGMPLKYKVNFDDPAAKHMSDGIVTVTDVKDVVIHHTRVIHIVENPLEDLTFGTPILERVYNLLEDLLKVSGGTAEMYWLTGNQGIQADIDKDMEIDPADAAALSEEIEEYHHQLRRFIRTRGVKLNVLGSSVPNPKEIFNLTMSLISGTTGIPRRILLGSEAGQLASEQDRANWAERIQERRALFATPSILEPIISLLQTVGLLPEGDVDWLWPSAFIQNPLEEGQTMAQFARAIGNMSRQTGNSAPMQITSRVEAREIIGFKGDLDESDLILPLEEEEEVEVDADGNPVDPNATEEDKEEEMEDNKADE